MITAAPLGFPSRVIMAVIDAEKEVTAAGEPIRLERIRSFSLPLGGGFDYSPWWPSLLSMVLARETVRRAAGASIWMN